MTDDVQTTGWGPDAAWHRGSTAERLALVAVGSVDRRAIAAAEFARATFPDTIVAIHVAVEPCAARELDTSWKRSSLGDLPLCIVDNRGGVAATIRSVTSELLADGAGEVIVVAGRLVMPGVGRLLLHDHTAIAIGHALTAVPRARVVLVPVASAHS